MDNYKPTIPIANKMAMGITARTHISADIGKNGYDRYIHHHDTHPVTIYLMDKQRAPEALLIWSSLVQSVGLHHANLSHIWVDTWIKMYGDTVDYRFAIGMRGSQPIGITIITQETNRPLPLPVRSFHIGANGEPFSEALQIIQNTLLVHERDRGDFINALVDTVQSTSRWEEIVLDGYLPNDAEQFISAVKKRGLKYSVLSEACRYYDFGTAAQSTEDFLANFSRDTRQTIRRSIRALESEITVEWAETPEHAADILNELIELYNKKWHAMGKRGMFASERFNSFHQEITKKLIGSGSVILCRVRSSKYGTLGCVYMIVNNGVAVGYQIGLRDFADIPLTTINKKRLRIGFIVHTKCMEECLRRGIKAYNFGVGEYAYKNELTNATSYSITASVQNSIKPKIREAIIRMYGSTLFQNTLHTMARMRQVGMSMIVLLPYFGQMVPVRHR